MQVTKLLKKVLYILDYWTISILSIHQCMVLVLNEILVWYKTEKNLNCSYERSCEKVVLYIL